MSICTVQSNMSMFVNGGLNNTYIKVVFKCDMEISVVGVATLQ